MNYKELFTPSQLAALERVKVEMHELAQKEIEANDLTRFSSNRADRSSSTELQASKA
jgi:hypothetical protein